MEDTNSNGWLFRLFNLYLPMLAENYNFEKYSQILHASTGIDIVSSRKIRNTGSDFIAVDWGHVDSDVLMTSGWYL